MFKTLHADLHRLKTQKTGVILAAVIPVIYVAVTILIEIAIRAMVKAEGLNYADMELIDYPELSSIVLGALVAGYVYEEFSAGTIRNRLITGMKRSHILLSKCIIAAVAALVIQLLASAATVILGVTIMDGFLLSAGEIVTQVVIYSAADISIAVLYTVLIYIFGNSKATPIVPVAVAFGFRVFMLVVLNKLYPGSGVTTLTGARLAIYTFFDRFCPFFYLDGFARWSALDYTIGCVGTTLIAVVVGLVVFEKKELN